MSFFYELINISNILAILCLEFFKYFFGFQNYYNTVINICNNLVNKNIIYAKVLQLDIFKFFNDDEHINEYLKTYCDNCPYENKDIDFDILHNLITYSKQNNDILKIDFDKPINSGTTAIVFKGKLNNKPVVVKLLRKNIRDQIKYGIDAFIRIVKILNFFYTGKSNVINILYKNKLLLLQQTDMLTEINNNKKFQNVSEIYDGFIKIPYIYDLFTTNVSGDVIIMEYLEGQQLTNINKENISQEVRIRFTKFILEMYTIHKVIHCDLHLGNIILINENIIGLIDFGLVTDINDEQANLIVDLFFTIKNSNYNRFIKTMAKIIINDEQYIKKTLLLCSDSPLIKKLLTNGSIITSKLCVDILTFFLKRLEIPHDSSAYYLVLSLVSSFSLIEFLKQNTNYTTHDCINNYLNS